MHLLLRWITVLSIATMLVIGDFMGFMSFSKAQGNGTTTRVSVASNGTQGNEDSSGNRISADGRYIVFRSNASNLVVNDTNGVADIFLHDRQTKQTIRISLAVDGSESNGASSSPSVSGNGRYVGFASLASNLVSNDTNGVQDIFLFDRQLEQMERISIASDGNQGNLDANGHYLSGDARYVAFDSDANNLVSGDINNERDAFIHDRQTGQTTLVSIASNGDQGNQSSSDVSISDDGRYVAFGSEASNLVNNDSNGYSDTFLHDRQTGQTTLVSVGLNGIQGNSSSGILEMSADGRYIAFTSNADNLILNDTNAQTDVFVYDRFMAQLRRISVSSSGIEGNNYSGFPLFSRNGRYVGFTSYADNLVEDDTNEFQDSFIHDLETGTTIRVSMTVDGTESNGASFAPTSSNDGRYVAFVSQASNLVANDTNAVNDVFMREWGAMVSTVFIPVSLQTYAFIGVDCAVLDSEPNNFYRDADRNASLCETLTVTGSVAVHVDDTDIYRIEVASSPATIHVHLANLPAEADYDLYLDAGPGNNLAFSTNAGSANETITIAVAPGQYYIRVVARQDGNPNSYELRWLRQ